MEEKGEKGEEKGGKRSIAQKGALQSMPYWARLFVFPDGLLGAES